MSDKKNWLEDLEADWRGAEIGEPREGDLVIEKSSIEGYHVRPAHELYDSERSGHVRILERAKPKSLDVVVASSTTDPDHERQVFINTGAGDYPWASFDQFGTSDELVDPVPLIEKPDIEELVEATVRAKVEWTTYNVDMRPFRELVREALEGVVG